MTADLPTPSPAAVSALIREVAARVIVPSFGRLAPGDITHKTPGALVTPVDLAAEKMLAAGLTRLLPAPVVGEEAVAAQPALLDVLDQGGDAWIVDPLDGTANYAAGDPRFGVLVALVRGGVLQGGWIFDPLGDRLLVAGLDGVTLNGQRISATGTADAGALTTWSFKGPLRERAEALARGLSLRLEHRCVAHDYLAIAEGRGGFALYGKINPWDHAAGAAMVLALGGRAGWLDGAPYQPRRHDRRGLLLAVSESVWQSVHERLQPPDLPLLI